MADVRLRPVTASDIEHLAANMRPADLAEALAYGPGIGPLNGLQMSVQASLVSRAVDIDGALAAVFGLVPRSLVGGTGAPWLMGTPVLDRHSRVLVRATAGYIRSMLALTPHLSNYVHARNARSVRWLKRVGFTVHPAVPYGGYGELFHPFELRA